MALRESKRLRDGVGGIFCLNMLRSVNTFLGVEQ